MDNNTLHTVVKINHFITGVLLVISTTFQLLALLGGVLLNEQNNFTTKMPWLVPVWCGMLALLIIAFVLLLKLRERLPWPLIIFVGAIIGAIAALIVALALRNALPGHLNVTGGTQGLTTWRLLYRHVSSVLVGVLIAVEATVYWVLCRRERRLAEAAAADTASSTIGLDSFAGDDSVYAKPKKLKRSLKYKKIKTEITVQGETIETNFSE